MAFFIVVLVSTVWFGVIALIIKADKKDKERINNIKNKNISSEQQHLKDMFDTPRFFKGHKCKLKTITTTPLLTSPTEAICTLEYETQNSCSYTNVKNIYGYMTCKLRDISVPYYSEIEKMIICPNRICLKTGGIYDCIKKETSRSGAGYIYRDYKDKTRNKYTKNGRYNGIEHYEVPITRMANDEQIKWVD